ncbi:MAG: UMP kinase [Mycoplasmataceae bacterium]|nr:UMP kinase [Mycoplasmataceae bacterium]
MERKNRIIIKLSGAALKEKDSSYIISNEKLIDLSKQIVSLKDKYEIGIVIGGGNIWRGGSSNNEIYNPAQADYMGMLATIINSIALKEAICKLDSKIDLYSLLEIPAIAKEYNIDSVNESFRNNKICIFAGGTGRPFCTTDTAASIRAVEIKANLILVAKDGVDGVYDSDPKVNKNAIRYEKLSLGDAIKMKLKVMDLESLILCEEYKINLLVFNMERNNAIVDAIERKIPVTIID